MGKNNMNFLLRLVPPPVGEEFEGGSLGMFDSLPSPCNIPDRYVSIFRRKFGPVMVVEDCRFVTSVLKAWSLFECGYRWYLEIQ